MLTPEDQAEVQSAIDAVPMLKGYHGPVARLGGLTNKVFRLDHVVLRLPGKGTEEIINRANEVVSARVAAAAGVSPEVLFADAKSGIMVTQLIANAVTMTPDGFRTRPGSPARAGQAFRKLHQSGGVFPFRFELFAMIDDYLKVIASKDVTLPEGYHGIVKEAQSIRTALAKSPAPLAPCHCDPLCENFLDVDGRMWIVDWEYCGMNDPMWDLGDLSVEGSFDESQDMEMLQAYFGGAPSDSDHGRMVIYKAMADLLWTLWGLIQHANQNPADDFHAYAMNRFNRCKALMATSEFAGHLRAIG